MVTRLKDPQMCHCVAWALNPSTALKAHFWAWQSLRVLWLSSLFAVLIVYGAIASPLQKTMSNAELRGTATLRFLGLSVYDARLFTKDGAALNWREDFALELTYRRNFSRKELVDSTLKEFERMGSALPVGQGLRQCFNDVGKGDRFLAITQGPNRIGFWFNNRQTCMLSHPAISKRFMEIFLGENTRSKAFTRKLKGE